ncbi:YitT family protein [Megamonas funiformis]
MNTKKSKLSQYVKKYIYIFIGSIITAIGLEIFLIPNNIIDGGVVGVSIMFSAITGLPFGTFLILINLPFLYLGYKHIGKAFAIATTFAVISLSFWSSVFLPVLPVTNDYFLAAVFGGIITGTGVGLIIRNGGSLDGTEIVAILTDKKTVFSVGEIVMFINLFILSSASLVFGWDKAMYSLVAYFVIAKMIDVVLKGLEETYSVMIVTSQHTDILNRLMLEMDKGVTVLHGEGGYTKEKRKILYCVVTRLEIDKLKNMVLDIDEGAFVTINPVSDIVGGRLRVKKNH